MNQRAQTPLVQANHTLPAWVYVDEGFYNAEKQSVFNHSWQIACHVSEIPNPGDYVTVDVVQYRAVVIRGDDGMIRTFHNVCRHRAHAVAQGSEGHCERMMQCGYHGWLYNFDGTLRGAPGEKEIPGFERSKIALPPVDMEVYLGFVWIRFAAEGPSVAERLVKYHDLLSAFHIETMVPNGKLALYEQGGNWKALMDNYFEGYHVPMSHPGFSALTEARYDVEADAKAGTHFATHKLKTSAEGISDPDIAEYLTILPRDAHLPDDHGERWSYISLFPMCNIELRPDGICYMNFFPLGPHRTVIRTRSFVWPQADAVMRRANQLGEIINAQVAVEDRHLTESVQLGLESGSYTCGILSDKEVAVRAFRDWIAHKTKGVRLDCS
jgi:phenylpropionate dioxygenase-like ring-hydroxylating dioxygenase large terminal subunit